MYRLSSLGSLGQNVQERITLFFDGKPARSLSAVEFYILNEGEQIIRDIRLRFVFATDTRVLAVSAKEEQELPGGIPIEHNIEEPNIAVIKIPYLNAFVDHRQRVSLAILCDGKVRDVQVSGGGEDWSSQYQEHYLISAKARTKNQRIMIGGMCIFLVLILIIVGWAHRISGKPFFHIDDYRLFAFQLFLVFGMSLFFAWAQRQTRRLLRMEYSVSPLHEEIMKPSKASKMMEEVASINQSIPAQLEPPREFPESSGDTRERELRGHHT